MTGQTRTPLVVVTNREPYVDEKKRLGIRTIQQAGGVVSALDPLLQEVHGHWVAWGSGSGDRVTAPQGSRLVPPSSPSYHLHRVFLDADEVTGYYDDYSNQGLWPISHLLVERAVFSRSAFGLYQRVNQKFADAVARIAPSEARVFSHDYHLTLFPALLRQQRPDLAIAHFWHIPWPPPMVWQFCPQAQELLEGLLSANLIGFQTSESAENFVQCVERFTSAKVHMNRQQILWQGQVVHVAAFPISVDVAGIRAAAESPRVERLVRRLHHEFAGQDGRLAVTVDRADYTKGLLQRLEGVDEFLERYPEHRRRFTLFQVLVPTRMAVDAYRTLFDDVVERTERLNAKWAQGDWTPLRSMLHAVDQTRLAMLYRAADVAIVNSLYDGMNLVAKEFVSAQVDRQGVLLLSRGAGAREELDQGLDINPLDPEGFAATLNRALTMPREERYRRMAVMQHFLSGHDIYDWADRILGTLEEVAEQRQWSISMTTTRSSPS